jgi:hypothetical protein
LLACRQADAGLDLHPSGWVLVFHHDAGVPILGRAAPLQSSPPAAASLPARPAPCQTATVNPLDMKKLPKTRFHLVFSLLMGAMMISLMTLVITLVNVGLVPDFIARWLRAFVIAYVVGVPVIYFLAPFARKLTGRCVEMP